MSRFFDFWTSEYGGAGAWSLTLIASAAALAGLSIDGTNGMRAKEQLQTSADIASHAGVVSLARGGDASAIRDASTTATYLNMPTELYGDVVGSATVSVKIGTYDGSVFTESNSGNEDAVWVGLSMNSANGNPVQTHLLNIIGIDSWDVFAASTSVFLKTKECNGNDGIYAHGSVDLTSSADFSADFCIFSKQGVEMSNHNVFQKGAHVSMPDLANCKQCEDAHNPGVEDAKLETNIQLTDVGAHVGSVMSSMLGLSSYSKPQIDFLSRVALDSNFTPLTDLGYKASGLKKGDIIQISASDFESMDFVPTGLTYAVYCSSPLSANGAITPSPGGGKTGGPGGGGSKKTLTFETPTGATIVDIAVMTDCELNFGATAYIQNSVIATDSTSNQSVSANSNARVGSSTAACPSNEKVTVMTQGDMRIPAGLETNNVDFLVAGDLNLASGTSTQATKRGTSFYVGGSAQIAAQGNWSACGDAADSLNGDLKVIRHVVVSNPSI